MKTRSILETKSISFLVILTTSLGWITCNADRSDKENYTAASSSYSVLAEKSLDLLARLDLETWGSMLSDSVVYYFLMVMSKMIRK